MQIESVISKTHQPSWFCNAKNLNKNQLKQIICLFTW